MIDQIKELRAKVPVSLVTAKELVGSSDSIQAAIERAREIYAEPVTCKTGVSVDEAFSALERTKGDSTAAIELIGWKTDFDAKERAARPTKTETRKAIVGTYTLYELLDAAGTDDDLVECPSDAPDPVVNLFAIFTFHSLYNTDSKLLFDEYAADHPRILTALRAAGLHDQADYFEKEIEEGEQSEQAFNNYIAKERKIFRAVRSYCETNLGVIHDWIYRD